MRGERERGEPVPGLGPWLSEEDEGEGGESGIGAVAMGERRGNWGRR